MTISSNAPEPVGAVVTPTRQLVGAGLIIVGSHIAAGVVVGLMWSLVAPRVDCTTDQNHSCLYSFEGGRFFIGEGMFAVIAVAGGVLAALILRRWLRDLGWPVVVALAVGGLLASVVAWRTGVWLGPDDPAGRGLVVGEVAELPLRLQTSALLLVWSIASVAVALITTALQDDLDQAARTRQRPPDPAELAAWIQGEDQERSTR